MWQNSNTWGQHKHILDEIRNRLNLGNTRYYSESFVFPSHIKNLKIKICKTVILPVVQYGCKPWSLTLREEHRLKVFGNGVLRKFGSKSKEDG
jgi:hypothetical protein